MPNVNEQRKARAKYLYAKCVAKHNDRCWITGRKDVRFNFHHKKMKSIYGGIEISKLCKSDADWKTIEDELEKCVLIGQHIHLAYHNFLRIFRNKQEKTYEFSLQKFKELYILVDKFNSNEIEKRKDKKPTVKRSRKKSA